MEFFIGRIHGKSSLNLAQSDGFTITKGDDIIEGEEDFEGVLLDVRFVQTMNTYINDNFMNETDGLEVLDDVGVLVGDKDEVHGFEGEIDVAYEFVFDKCVLLCGADRFGEVTNVLFEGEL
jgi:hypothetical protein